MSDTPVIVAGTTVSTTLYNRGLGVVYAVHGTPSPQSVRRVLSGAMVTGGSAFYDIVFYDGSLSRRLPEAILLGCQWTIHDDRLLVDAASRQVMLEKAEQLRLAKEHAERERKDRFAAEVAALRVNPDYAHLHQGDDGSGVLAAKNMRILLKAAFPNAKFRIRKQSYGSVTVSYEGEAQEEAVKAITQRFKTGSYNHLSDCHSTTDTPWSTVFGGVQYVF